METRCRWHSKYIWSLFDRSCFYKMKAVKKFLRWVGFAPSFPSGWVCAPEPAFLQWHKELKGLTNQYTKLKTTKEITLVKICIIETHFLPFFVSHNINKYIISTNRHFLQSVNVDKSLRIYHLEYKKHKKSICVGYGFYL